MRIVKYANMFTLAKAVQHFKDEFPDLSESTIRPWLKSYRENLQKKTPMQAIVLSKKRGRPLYLPTMLDSKLQKFLKNLRKAGGGVNRHVVKGVLMGLIKSDLEAYGSLLDFHVSEGWIRSLYRRMIFSRRTATTSRPIIRRSIWEDALDRLLHAIVSACIGHNIPDELIINADQTPSKYVATDKIMAEKNVSIKGSSDKHQITATFAETLAGDILPFQLIYKGKTKRSLPPNVTFPGGFLLSVNERHLNTKRKH